MVATNWCDVGTITFGRPVISEVVSRVDAEQKLVLERTFGVWRPRGLLRPFQERGFSVPVELLTTPSGYRQFRLRCSLDELRQVGPEVGLAIIEATRDPGQESVFSYRRMHQVFRHVQRMQEHLRRRFRYARDLYVRTTGRLSDRQRSIFPNGLGKDSNRKGRTWSVSTLIRRGREAARAAGLARPTQADAIDFGLLEAARRNPLTIESGEAANLVRMTLFDLEGSEGRVDPVLLDRVTERFLVAVEQNRDKDTEAFHEWCLGSGNTLAKQIAKQTKAPGGRLDLQEVRQALLHLGWQAYRPSASVRGPPECQRPRAT